METKIEKIEMDKRLVNLYQYLNGIKNREKDTLLRSYDSSRGLSLMKRYEIVEKLYKDREKITYLRKVIERLYKELFRWEEDEENI